MYLTRKLIIPMRKVHPLRRKNHATTRANKVSSTVEHISYVDQYVSVNLIKHQLPDIFFMDKISSCLFGIIITNIIEHAYDVYRESA